MLIKTLAENTSISDEFDSEHGLSFYIESNGGKFLFDTGASDLFSNNAKKLSADIQNAEFLFLSHGHYDHGGGLKTFLEQNQKAKIYAHERVFEPHLAMHQKDKLDYIGLDQSLKENERFVFTSQGFKINENVEILADVVQKRLTPKLNKSLFMEHNGEVQNDTFAHEQNLVIKENGKYILITGCAHNGIVNILEQFHKNKGFMPDVVIGGFHLYGRSGGNEPEEVLVEIAEYLLNTNAKFYTCHCTGVEPFERLKDIMGDCIDYLSTGSQITI